MILCILTCIYMYIDIYVGIGIWKYKIYTKFTCIVHQHIDKAACDVRSIDDLGSADAKLR